MDGGLPQIDLPLAKHSGNSCTAPDSSLLTFRQGGARKPGVGDGAAISGMLFVWHTGIPWEELPRPWAGAVA